MMRVAPPAASIGPGDPPARPKTIVAGARNASQMRDPRLTNNLNEHSGSSPRVGPYQTRASPHCFSRRSGVLGRAFAGDSSPPQQLLGARAPGLAIDALDHRGRQRGPFGQAHACSCARGLLIMSLADLTTARGLAACEVVSARSRNIQQGGVEQALGASRRAGLHRPNIMLEVVRCARTPREKHLLARYRTNRMMLRGAPSRH